VGNIINSFLSLNSMTTPSILAYTISMEKTLRRRMKVVALLQNM
jgi:hypothetical protein